MSLDRAIANSGSFRPFVCLSGGPTFVTRMSHAWKVQDIETHFASHDGAIFHFLEAKFRGPEFRGSSGSHKCVKEGCPLLHPLLKAKIWPAIWTQIRRWLHYITLEIFLHHDLAPFNIGLATAYHRAQNRQAWSKLVRTATSSSGQATWWWWWWWGICNNLKTVQDRMLVLITDRKSYIGYFDWYRDRWP